MQIRAMTIDDHDTLLQLLTETPGVTLREADSRKATASYLERNTGLSFVAICDDSIVGCIMSGHDGRRGYLQHLVVEPQFRRQGIGEKLVQSCLDALAQEGILKTHLFVFKDNDLGNSFWTDKGWILRDEINMYSFNDSVHENI